MAADKPVLVLQAIERTYRQGDALMEAMDTAHFGADAGPQPVRILTVYMGAEGAPADVIPVQP